MHERENTCSHVTTLLIHTDDVSSRVTPGHVKQGEPLLRGQLRERGPALFSKQRHMKCNDSSIPHSLPRVMAHLSLLGFRLAMVWASNYEPLLNLKSLPHVRFYANSLRQ